MIIALVPLLVALCGVMMFALAEGKLAEVGRIAFAVGLLVLVWTLATAKAVTL